MRPADSLKDIKSFVDNLRLDSSSINPSDRDARTLYRRFHALLIWHHLVDRDNFSTQTRTYVQECIADASAAYFLTTIGLYKAARASMRSGIENLYRIIVSETGDSLSDYSSVPALLLRAKEASKTDNQRQRLGTLYSTYGTLCLTVHSTDKEYMSLKVPFEKMVQHIPKEAKSNFKLLDDAYRLMNDILFIELAHHLHLIDFKNADILRDAVEAIVKGEAAALFG